MEYFRVANWDTLQHYKDRSPPWIKLHNSLLDDYQFSCLQDASKAHLFAIMMLASRTDNKLPVNPEWIKHKISATCEVDINALLDSGYIELIESNQLDSSASNPLAGRYQDASPEKRRVEQSRGEGEKSQSPARTKNYPPEFESFWRAYPSNRKGSKQRALVEWENVNPDDYELIVNHVLQRKVSDPDWLKEQGKFICHAERFIKGCRWEETWTVPLPYSEATARTITNLTGLDLNG